MDLKQSLGEAVRERRIKLGLSQAELAERMGCGIQQSDVSRIERGYIPWPRPDLLQALAAALQMHAIELIPLGGWMSEDECERFYATQEPDDAKPLAILGMVDIDDELAASAAKWLPASFRKMMTFGGNTLLESIVSQAPRLVIVHQDSSGVDIQQLDTAVREHGLETNVIVVGHRRSAVPRDLRFHYLKAPATTEAIGSMLGAIGYRPDLSA